MPGPFYKENNMKKFLIFLFLLFSVGFAVDASVYTEMQINEGLTVLGTTTLGTVAADSLAVDLFFELDPASTVDTSSANNATVTPVSTYQPLDTYGDVAISTVDNVVTAGITTGTLLYLQSTLASQDIIWTESGNMDLGAARTLTDPLDLLILLKTGANQFIEAGFFDNN